MTFPDLALQLAWGSEDISYLTLHGSKRLPRENLRGEPFLMVFQKATGRRLRESGLTALTAFTHHSFTHL